MSQKSRQWFAAFGCLDDVVKVETYDPPSAFIAIDRDESFRRWSDSQRELQDELSPFLEKFSRDELVDSLVLVLVHRQIDRIVPSEFEWQFEIGWEREHRVRFRRRGSLGEGIISDPDYRIMLALLRQVSWRTWQPSAARVAPDVYVPNVRNPDAFERARAEILVRRGLGPQGSAPVSQDTERSDAPGDAFGRMGNRNPIAGSRDASG